MSRKILFSVVVALMSLAFANEADAQRHGRRGGDFHRGGGFYRGPRVAVVVRPPAYCPPPRYYGRGYSRHRGTAFCGRGHRGCSDRLCFNDGNRGRRYDRHDRNGYRDRDYRNDGRRYDRY